MTPEEIEKLIKLHVEKLRKQLQKEIEEKIKSSLENMKKDINMNAEAMIGTECFIDSESVIHYVKDLTCSYRVIQRECWKEIQLLEADCRGDYYVFAEYLLHDSLEDLEKLIK